MQRGHQVFQKKSGFSVVELVVAAAIIVALVTTSAAVWQKYLSVSLTSSENTQAALITEEVTEALNLLRDSNWTTNISSLSLDVPYFIYWNGNGYATSPSTTTFNGIYSASFILDPIYRDLNNNITATGGTLDNNSRTVTVTVSLASTSAPVMQSYILLHNVFKN